MADPYRTPENWVDELLEKHECGGYYHEPIRFSLEHAGKTLTLLLPFELDDGKIVSVTVSESGELLYLIGKQPLAGYEPPFQGLLLVGRRRAPDTYAIVIWHTLYPWALKYLGLEEEAS